MNIAQNLPVRFQPGIELYTWNTNGSTAAQYQRVVRSLAYLAFVFESPGIGTITIKVPFAVLNLTLEALIVSTRQQYFPCHPFYANDGSGYYEFGKAFLQAAFISMNWGQNKWFMAQAPGPGVGASNVQPIGDFDTSINADPIDNFAKTWARNWTPVSQSESGTEGNKSSGVVSSKAGLSAGAKAAIGVGVTYPFYLIIRSFRLNRQRHHNLSLLTHVQEKDADHVPYELSADSQRFELGDGDAGTFHAQ